MDSKGNYYMYCGTSSGPVLYKVSSNLSIQKQKLMPPQLGIRKFFINSKDQLIFCGWFQDSIIVDNVLAVSNGSFDIFIGVMSTDLTLINHKIVGGKDFDFPGGIVSDKLGRLYLAGTIRDTVDFGDTLINCLKSGNGFLARLRNDLSTELIVRDSTHEDLGSDYGGGIGGICINDQNDLVLTGGGAKDFYYIFGTKIEMPPDHMYHYYYTYGVCIDSALVVKWKEVFAGEKFGSRGYAGYTSKFVCHLHDHYSPGDAGQTDVELVNNSGYHCFNPCGNARGGELGVYLDQAFFLSMGEYWNIPYSGYLPYYDMWGVTDSLGIPIGRLHGSVAFCNLVWHNEEVFLTGIYRDSLTASPHSVATIGSQVFVIKMSQDINMSATHENNTEDESSIYPNPSHGFFFVGTSGLTSENSVEVYDIVGKEVPCHFDGNKVTLDAAEGVYFVSWSKEKRRVIKKIVVSSR
jgi:hypothetical protein